MFIVQIINPREINARSLNFIKEFEKWEPCAYTNAAAEKNLSIGYGHKVKSGESFTNGTCIIKEQGLELLKDDLSEASACIEKTVQAPLTDNQFGALVSWIFNVGCPASSQSTLVRILNAGNANQICDELRKDNKVLIKSVRVNVQTTINTWQISSEVIRRREDECALYKSNGDNPTDRFNMTCTMDEDYLNKYPGNRPCIANYYNKEGMSCNYTCKFEPPKTCNPDYMGNRRSHYC